MGRAHDPVVVARRHHRGCGQLRRGVRAGARRRSRAAHRADGRRRGHPRRHAARGPGVELALVPRVHGRGRRPPVRRGRRVAGPARCTAVARDGRARRAARGGHARRHRDDGRTCSRRDRGRCARLLHVAHPQPSNEQGRAHAHAHGRSRRARRHRHRDRHHGQGRPAGRLRLRRRRCRVRDLPAHGRGFGPAVVVLAPPGAGEQLAPTARAAHRGERGGRDHDGSGRAASRRAPARTAVHAEPVPRERGLSGTLPTCRWPSASRSCASPR